MELVKPLTVPTGGSAKLPFTTMGRTHHKKTCPLVLGQKRMQYSVGAGCTYVMVSL